MSQWWGDVRSACIAEIPLSLISVHQGHFHHIQSRIQQLQNESRYPDGMTCQNISGYTDRISFSCTLPKTSPRTQRYFSRMTNQTPGDTPMEWCPNDQQVPQWNGVSKTWKSDGTPMELQWPTKDQHVLTEWCVWLRVRWNGMVKVNMLWVSGAQAIHIKQ